MDSYTKPITLDVSAESNYTIIKAKQGDKINRKIAITLKKDGANFTPSGVSQIWFRVEKPDKNVCIVKSTDSGNPITSSGNVFTVSLTEQCLTCSGKAWCDIAFMDASGNTLSSAAFIMNIIPMPNGNTANSSSAWTDLQQAIDDLEAALAQLDETATQIISDAADEVVEETQASMNQIVSSAEGRINSAVSDAEDRIDDSVSDAESRLDAIVDRVENELQPAIDDAERFAAILQFRTNGDYIQYTVDGQTWINLMPKSEISGDVYDTILDEAKTRSKLNTKNLLIQNGEDSTTKAGVTFTKNANGTITVNGTATATAFFEVTRNVDFGNAFITSATNEGQAINGYIMTSGIGGRSDIALEYNRNNKITAIKITSGATYDNLIIYPMIRLATDIDNSFQKYAPTNAELNDAINEFLGEEIAVDFSTAITGKYVSSSTGAINNGNNYNLLRNVTLKKGQTISLTSVAYTTVAPIALETGTSNLTPLFSGNTNDAVKTYRFTASVDCAVALSVDTNYSYSAAISGCITDLNDAINNKVPYTNANEISFTNGQKIGDLADNRFYVHTNNDNGKYYNYFFTPPDASETQSRGFNVATNQDISNLSGVISDEANIRAKLNTSNLLNNTASTATVQSVLFTVNSDKSVTVNGTSGGWNGFLLNTFVLKAGRYTVKSGITDTNIAFNCYLEIKSGTQTIVNTESTSKRDFILEEDAEITVKIHARPNIALNNVVVYPEIKYQNDLSNYVPYAPTNAELNGALDDKVNNIWWNATERKIKKQKGTEITDVLSVDYTPEQNSPRPISSNAVYELNGAINEGIAKSVQAVDYLTDFDNMAEYTPYFAAGRVKMFRVKVSTLNAPEAPNSWGLTVVMFANGGNQFVQYYYGVGGVYRRTAAGDNTFSTWTRLADDGQLKYHKGDTYVFQNGMTILGMISRANNNAFGVQLVLPKEIGSDVTSFTYAGTPNFWTDSGVTNRITGITVSSVAKLGVNYLGINGNLPSGTTRPSDTIGAVNFVSGSITFN